MSKTSTSCRYTRIAYLEAVDLLMRLRAFVAVAEEGSFTGAAAATTTPQPVLSRRVASLEHELGGPVFDREPRGVRLTTLGQAVLPHARDVVVRTDHLLDVARAQVLSDVRAALPVHADPQALARLRQRLRGRGVSLALHEDAPAAREEALARGVVQLARLPVAPDRAQVRVRLGGASLPARLRGRRLHLEQLRPSEDEPGDPPRLLIQAEDDVPHVRDLLTQHAHAAGLAADHVVTGLPLAEAWTAVHERGDVLVCAEVEAARQGLPFRHLALDVVRGYRLRVAPEHPGAVIVGDD